MKLTELFKKTVPWKWTTNTKTTKVATFNIEDETYEVGFSTAELFPEGAWMVEFGILQQDMLHYGVTDLGHGYEVLSTVMEIFNEFVKTQDPNVLVFGAEEESRRKLYNRMVSRFKGKYNVETKVSQGELVYILYKPDVDEETRRFFLKIPT